MCILCVFLPSLSGVGGASLVGHPSGFCRRPVGFGTVAGAAVWPFAGLSPAPRRSSVRSVRLASPVGLSWAVVLPRVVGGLAFFFTSNCSRCVSGDFLCSACFVFSLLPQLCLRTPAVCSISSASRPPKHHTSVCNCHSLPPQRCYATAPIYPDPVQQVQCDRRAPHLQPPAP